MQAQLLRYLLRHTVVATVEVMAYARSNTHTRDVAYESRSADGARGPETTTEPRDGSPVGEIQLRDVQD